MKKQIIIVVFCVLFVMSGCSTAPTKSPDDFSSPGEISGENSSGQHSSSGGGTVSVGLDDPVAAVKNEDGLYGYININGEWVIAPQYYAAYPFSENVATVLTEYEGTWKLINKDNDTIAELPSDVVVVTDLDAEPHWHLNYPQTIIEGMIIIGTNEVTGQLFGFADIKGDIILEPKYQGVHRFSEGLAAVNFGADREYNYGFINASGKTVIEPRFYSVGNFHCGLATVMAVYGGDQNGFIDTNGILAITYNKTTAGSGVAYVGYLGHYTDFYDGVAVIKSAYADTSISMYDKTAWRVGLMDTTGNSVLRLENYGGDNRNVSSLNMEFQEGLCPVYDTKVGTTGIYPVGFIDTDGILVIEPQENWYLDDSLFSEGYCKVIRGETYGYIDTSGTIVIECRYTKALDFTNGLAAVESGFGNWQFINKEGKPAFDKTFQDALPFTK